MINTFAQQHATCTRGPSFPSHIPDDTARTCPRVSLIFQCTEMIVCKSYQTKRLGHQRPRAQELANDETPQDGLDLGDTAVLGIDGIFLHEQRRTVRKEDAKGQEEKVLDGPLARSRVDAKRLAPEAPSRALGALVVAVAAKALVQVKVASLGSARAEAQLDVAQPVGGDVDEGRNHAHRQARQQQHDPDLAGVQQVADVADDAAARARRQQAQALALLCVLEDPVDGRQVLVGDSPPGAFGVPVGGEAVFGVQRCERGRVLVAIAIVWVLRLWRRRGRAGERRKDSQRVRQQRGPLLALEGQRRAEVAVDGVVVEDIAIVVAEEVELVAVFGRGWSDDDGRLRRRRGLVLLSRAGSRHDAPRSIPSPRLGIRNARNPMGRRCRFCIEAFETGAAQGRASGVDGDWLRGPGVLVYSHFGGFWLYLESIGRVQYYFHSRF